MKPIRIISVLLLLTFLAGCSFPIDSFAPFFQQPTTAVEDLLTQEDAKLIALDHAKAALEDTQNLRISFEYDDGIPEYDISFFFLNYEYEYEIHGVSGRIVSYERETY